MRIAALTLVRNEPDFFPLWVKYYEKEVDELFVINPLHQTYPSKWTEVKIEGDGGIPWGMIQINNTIRDLLDRFDWVIYSDVDEYIIPKHGDIRAFLKFKREAMFTCKGMDVFHDGEPPIDFSKPILRQRKSWIPAHAYNKTNITRIPIVLAEGAHYTQEEYSEMEERKIPLRQVVEEHITPNLYLVHLKRCDKDIFVKRKGSYWADEVNLKEDIPEWIKDRL